VTGVAEERLVKGRDDWRAPYAAQRALRVEQLWLMAKFAESDRCRMLSLVEHFGDQQDSGERCGLCDQCAPGASIKAQRPAPESIALSVPGKTRGKRTRKPTQRRRSASSRGKSSRRRASRTPAVALPASGPSAPLVATLRAWRLQESKKKRVPAFRVLTNRALVAIAEARPSTAASLRAVTGVGPKLLQTYGAQLVALCRAMAPEGAPEGS
jgi:superfamily II DNA helicase RecQ